MASPSLTSRLNNDILWSIFSLNSHPIICPIDHGDLRQMTVLREASLITMRRTSQVCQEWREVVLYSPSLWANAIDLQHLNQARNDWREEVLSRTGDAPLSMVGSIDDDNHTSDMLGFFLHILDTQWERIRSLVIFSDSESGDAGLFLALARRAPLLEFFNVRLKTYRNDRIIPFANHAPSLVGLNICQQVIDLSSLSLAGTSQIRYLNLSVRSQNADPAVSELLSTLSNMPFLETLDIMDMDMELNSQVLDNRATGPTNIPHINLAKLYKLKINESTFTPTAKILSHITIPLKCSVHIIATHYLRSLNATVDLDTTDYLNENFASWDITQISYKVKLAMLGSVHVPYYRQGFALYRTHGGTRELKFDHSSLTWGANTAFYMANALLSCDLRHVTTFTLILEGEDTQTLPTRPPFGRMRDFVRLLGSVRTFVTTEKTLEVLLAGDSPLSDFPFPKLWALIVDKWDISVDDFLFIHKDNMRVFKRVVLARESDVPVGDPSVLAKAQSAGVTVGWLVGGQEGLREFPPITIKDQGRHAEENYCQTSIPGA